MAEAEEESALDVFMREYREWQRVPLTSDGDHATFAIRGNYGVDGYEQVTCTSVSDADRIIFDACLAKAIEPMVQRAQRGENFKALQEKLEIAERALSNAREENLALIKAREPQPGWRELREADPHGNRYDREQSTLAGGHLTDDQVAYRVAMLMRNDLEHEAVLHMARDRIRWLSRQKHKAEERIGRMVCDLEGEIQLRNQAEAKAQIAEHQLATKVEQHSADLKFERALRDQAGEQADQRAKERDDMALIAMRAERKLARARRALDRAVAGGPDVYTVSIAEARDALNPADEFDVESDLVAKLQAWPAAVSVDGKDPLDVGVTSELMRKAAAALEAKERGAGAPIKVPAPELASWGPPAERTRKWVLWFEDDQVGHMVLNDEADAQAAYERHAPNWNCTLFETSVRKNPIRTVFIDPLGEILSAADVPSAMTLLPCPFCGAEPTVEPWHGGALGKVRISCDCEVGPSSTDDDPQEAARAWNQRGGPPA